MTDRKYPDQYPDKGDVRFGKKKRSAMYKTRVRRMKRERTQNG